MFKGVVIYGKNGLAVASTNNELVEGIIFDWTIRRPGAADYVTFEGAAAKLLVITCANKGTEELVRNELKIWDFGGDLQHSDIFRATERHSKADEAITISVFTDKAVHIFTQAGLIVDHYHETRNTVVRMNDPGHLNVTAMETAASMDDLSLVIIDEPSLKVMEWFEFK